jgi:methylglutaconyl-CoA hydratase
MLPELSVQGRCARIELRDPERRNALSAAALQRFAELTNIVQDGTDLGVLVVSGAGQSFCSGFDLEACVESPLAVEPLLMGLADCVMRLRALDIPVVARVQGAALAGGCALLTGCDFVIVARDAQIGYPVHRIGISPAVSAPSLLSRMGPASRALMISNDILDGASALARGLATDCVEPAALDATVDALVERLLAKGPQAMRATKRLIRSIEERGAGDIGPGAPRDACMSAATRDASIGLAGGDEFATMLRAFWSARTRGR